MYGGSGQLANLFVGGSSPLGCEHRRAVGESAKRLAKCGDRQSRTDRQSVGPDRSDSGISGSEISKVTEVVTIGTTASDANAFAPETEALKSSQTAPPKAPGAAREVFTDR